MWGMAGTADATRVLRTFRRARRRHRLAGVRWLDLITDAYGTALAIAVGGSVLIDAFGGLGRLGSAAGFAAPDVRSAAFAGTLLAAVVLLGAREGRLGGPLALDAAHVRHVLSSPIDRAHALRGPLRNAMARRFLLGIAAGAGFGFIAARSFSGALIPFLAGGAICGGISFGVAVATAVLTNRRARPARWPAAAACTLVAWGVLDTIRATRTSPASWLATTALGPRRSPLVTAAGVGALIIVTAVALARVGTTSIELAERRAALVSMVRFSIATQDLRSVIVLRRLLTLEIPRRRPWLRIDPWATTSLPAWRRGWHGLLRWPAGRVVRCLSLGAGTGASAVGAWRGTNMFIVVAGICLYVAALDVVEPLAQEDDHPRLRDMQPVDPPRLALRLLGAPVAALAAIAAIGLVGSALVAGPLGFDAHPVAMAALLAVPAAAGAAAGAMWSLMAKPPDPASPQFLIQPETFGVAVAAHYGTPVLLASLGFAPLLLARYASRAGTSVIATVLPSVAVAALTLGFILYLITTRAATKGKLWNQ